MSCKKCGLCCKNMYLYDKIMISLHTKSFMFSKDCKFLNKDNTCKIYNNRPKLCRDWKCGASKN